MWAFLGSDVLFFGTLIATHLIYQGQSLSGPTEEISRHPDNVGEHVSCCS